MAEKRASKEKRQRRNRAQREARAARSARAGEATSIAKGEREPAVSAQPADTSTPKTSRVVDTDDPKAQRRAAAAERRAAARERMQARYPIPGQRAMFLGLIFTAVFVATTLFTEFPTRATVTTDDPRVESADDFLDGATILIAQEALGDDAPAVEIDIYENKKLFDARSVPVGVAILAVPSIICAVAYRFTKKPQRNTVWTICMFALTGYFMFAQPYSLFVMPSLVAVGVAAFQSRKAENAPRLAELRAQREAQRQARLADEDSGTASADDADEA